MVDFLPGDKVRTRRSPKQNFVVVGLHESGLIECQRPNRTKAFINPEELVVVETAADSGEQNAA